MKPTKTIANDD